MNTELAREPINGVNARTGVGEHASTAPLQLSGVVKSFAGSVVLDLDELVVQPGEVHALIGQNGSGKSTIIKIMAGYHEPDAFEAARAAGHDVELGSTSAPGRAGWRFVHQDLGLVGPLSAVDNLSLGVGYTTGPASRIKWRQATQEAERAIQALGYSFDVRERVEKLAPVERTALAIARALREQGTATSLLVLDEPTATMPRPEVNRLLELVRRVAESGTAVLCVSHHLDEVMAVADRVTVLRDGHVVECARVADVTKKHLVQKMTGGLIHDIRSEEQVDIGADHPVVLQVRGLSGQYLETLDLTVRAGEVVGIAGITGSGRDEVGGLLFGSRERRGDVVVEGSPVGATPADSIRRGIGFVPANRLVEGLMPELTIRENATIAMVAPHWRGLRLRHRAEKHEVAGLRARFGVRGGHDEQAIQRLSGGNQQKISIAKWMRLKPRLLVLDDPTQGVDVGAQADIHRLVVESATDGAAVVVCSADEVELASICHRVLVLREGRVARELTGDEITVAAIVNESLSAETLGQEGTK